MRVLLGVYPQCYSAGRGGFVLHRCQLLNRAPRNRSNRLAWRESEPSNGRVATGTIDNLEDTAPPFTGPPFEPGVWDYFPMHIPHQRHGKGLLRAANAVDASSMSRRKVERRSSKVGGMQMPSCPDVKRASQAKSAGMLTGPLLIHVMQRSGSGETMILPCFFLFFFLFSPDARCGIADISSWTKGPCPGRCWPCGDERCA